MTSEAAKKLELEKKMLAASMAECTKLVESMRTQKPPEAERSKARLDDMVKVHTKLPPDFKRKILTDARNYECIANTRATDAALQLALEKARKDEETERNRLVGEARNFCAKAMSLGAATSFRATANRKIEIIMMTGHVEHKGPTVAKPLDNSPRPTSAKA